ncbi:acyl-CoA carboxylase subunit epsilon [Kineococcus gypseus]|uniref:acyl-CoA carboxylase subunit epsilon n=1 Tax=Kineococcus gypseus TaxID=1637102 RepID=UPI003D7DF1A2
MSAQPAEPAGTGGGTAAGTAAAALSLLSDLRIERGHPEPEELAALTVVLTTLAAAPAVPPPPPPASRWADRRRALGLPPAPGPGAWRASALPR